MTRGIQGPSVARRKYSHFLFVLCAVGVVPGRCSGEGSGCPDSDHRSAYLALCDLLDGIRSRRKTAWIDFVEFLGSSRRWSLSWLPFRREGNCWQLATPASPISNYLSQSEIRPSREGRKSDTYLFPSAKLIFLINSTETVRTGVRQGEGFQVVSAPQPSLQVVLSAHGGEVATGRGERHNRQRPDVPEAGVRFPYSISQEN